MSCESALNFLCDVLKKNHVDAVLLSLHDSADKLMAAWLHNLLADPDDDTTVQQAVGSIEDRTLYRFSDQFHLQYLLLRVPLLSEKNILYIGPYLLSPLSSQEVWEVGERLGATPPIQKLLRDYYAAVPCITDSAWLFSVLDTFCEQAWQTSSYAVVDQSRDISLLTVSAVDASQGQNMDEITANMKLMEQRYAYENEIIQAVTLGQLHKAGMLSGVFNEQLFEKRLQDPLRNAKNYCIIMNTLLRKAAEQGGVHPIYIDRTSSHFAVKIEMTTDLNSIPDLMRKMFSEYCRLVQKHTTGRYSTIVKKAILMIDSDISAELSLGTLAEAQGISTGYLATLFKRETGKTVLEYIRNRRIDRAVHLLNTTNLQIQTVAMHCGIMDVQYFCKLFKKQLGKTPKEYRESLRR